MIPSFIHLEKGLPRSKVFQRSGMHRHLLNLLRNYFKFSKTGMSKQCFFRTPSINYSRIAVKGKVYCHLFREDFRRGLLPGSSCSGELPRENLESKVQEENCPGGN